MWIPFNATVTARLEVLYFFVKTGKRTLFQAAYAASEKQCKVDDERFVDMTNKKKMGQRRYDDPDKIRKVKREEKADDSESEDEPGPEPENSDGIDPPPHPGIDYLWQWAGDSGGGSQNVWIDFPDGLQKELEKSLIGKVKQCKVPISLN